MDFKGNRKFIMALYAFTAVYVALLIGRLIGSEFLTAIGVILTLFFGANVVKGKSQ
jgi:hypothetical protein